jgi:hypothetical protein
MGNYWSTSPNYGLAAGVVQKQQLFFGYFLDFIFVADLCQENCVDKKNARRDAQTDNDRGHHVGGDHLTQPMEKSGYCYNNGYHACCQCTCS